MKEELVVKFLNDQCSPEELTLVSQWLRKKGHEKELEEIISRHWENIHPGQLSTRHRALLSKIHAGLHDRQINPAFRKPAPNTNYYLKIAASVLIFIFSAVAILSLTTTLSDTNIAHTTIRKATDYGEKQTVVLPDGTKVILNAASSLEYDEAFLHSGYRIVRLTGEAYFHVAHNEEKPFRVVTDLMETTVLGTKFNINEREDKVEVSLAQGKVRVHLRYSGAEKIAELSPGEMATTRAGTKQLSVSNVNVRDKIAWTEGIITFKSLPLADIISRLERWYDVEISLDDDIDERLTVSGEFNNENLENILSGLSFSMNFQYIVSGKKVFIKKK